MSARRSDLVLVVHRLASMRRILRLNLESEGMTTVEAATAGECARLLGILRPAAVVLDPQVLHNQDDEGALCARLRELRAPILVVSDGPEYRQIARSLGDAPFCNRPDDVERITAAVRALLAGSPLPTIV